MKSEIFENELNCIEDENLRAFCTWYLDNKVGEWFWTSGASASGKFHPKFAQGKGGLVRHTKAVVMFCMEFLKMSTYSYMNDLYKDYAIIACILHDTCKYGTKNTEDKSVYANHGHEAAFNVEMAWFEYFHKEVPELLYLAIQSHMGQWCGEDEQRPFTQIDRLVHLSDYVASRNFIDIPTLR